MIVAVCVGARHHVADVLVAEVEDTELSHRAAQVRLGDVAIAVAIEELEGFALGVAWCNGWNWRHGPWESVRERLMMSSVVRGRREHR